ncbi:hypothetical protein Rxycam_01512 [Rubrobacter xylanophilus DSM 9941]|nr:hypothetical protein [Rubrobacter xylanophilus]QYJ15685.1 hypothetical protein Rxycam_01512 [Rubrobacter xylanophilus DSM 9941]
MLLSFDRDCEALLLSMPADSPTGGNLAATRTVRLALGHTRDVSVIDGDVKVLEIGASPERADRFAARTGFDPRLLSTPYAGSTSARVASVPGARRTSWTDASLCATAAGLTPADEGERGASMREP